MSDAHVRVELFEHETIAERGTRKLAWRVRLGDGWFCAEEIEGAEVEILEPAAGTIWERRIGLLLAPGTELLRIDSEPALESRRDPLSYLEREVRQVRRRTRRRVFRVTPRGDLVEV